MPPPLVQIKRTEDFDKPPTGLAPGELAVEMAVPVRLWVGVPPYLDGSGKKLLIDATAAGDFYTRAEADARFVNVPGDTMTGDLINLANITAQNVVANNNVLATGAINAGASIFSGGILLSGNGQVVSRAGPFTDANFWFEDENAATLGVITWDRQTAGLYTRNESWGPAVADLTLLPGNSVQAGLGIASRQGTAMGYSTSVHNWNWTGSAVQVFVDATNLGDMTIVSDYRAKKDVQPLESMWNIVKALRPIKYTLQDFTTPADIEFRNAEADRSRDKGTWGMPPNTVERPASTIVGDDYERWGFIAHELQETLTETAATSYKDAPDAVQSPNPFTVIAALTKALQEAMTRIEALEAKG